MCVRSQYIIKPFFTVHLSPEFLPVSGPLTGGVSPHLAQSCYIALGGLLIWGLYPDVRFEGLYLFANPP